MNELEMKLLRITTKKVIGQVTILKISWKFLELKFFSTKLILILDFKVPTGLRNDKFFNNEKLKA